MEDFRRKSTTITYRRWVYIIKFRRNLYIITRRVYIIKPHRGLYIITAKLCINKPQPLEPSPYLFIVPQKNEKVKNWINPNIECCETKDPINDLSWLVSKTNFGKYDFSCLLLYKNNSTNKYYIVNHYIDFEFRRAFESNNATNFIIIYKCDGQRINGGHFLVRNSDFYEHLNFTPNKNLEKSI